MSEEPVLENPGDQYAGPGEDLVVQAGLASASAEVPEPEEEPAEEEKGD